MTEGRQALLDKFFYVFLEILLDLVLLPSSDPPSYHFDGLYETVFLVLCSPKIVWLGGGAR